MRHLHLTNKAWGRLEGISADNRGEESSSLGRDPRSECRVDGNRVGPEVGSPRGVRGTEHAQRGSGGRGGGEGGPLGGG